MSRAGCFEAEQPQTRADLDASGDLPVASGVDGASRRTPGCSNAPVADSSLMLVPPAGRLGDRGLEFVAGEPPL